MYKYCRDIMWSVEEDAFVATVAELPECKAVGKTVSEVVNNLDIAIEKWIEMANSMGKAIPDPFHSEPSHKEQHNHRHDFASVVEFLLKRPEYFSIEGFEDYYSQQERDLLSKIAESVVG